jgi:sugar phosphate isomerase/epimerase
VLEEVAALTAAHGIKTSSYGTYFRLGVTPFEELEHYVSAARRLGTDHLRLWCGTKSGADMSALECERLTDECRRAAALAERCGVTLSMECHKSTLTERPEDALRLMEEVGSRRFLMYWQPFQWQEEAEQIAYARALAPYVTHLHVFHWRGTGRYPLADAVPAWRSYLEAIGGVRTLLLEFMPDDAITTLPTEADALRRIAE